MFVYEFELLKIPKQAHRTKRVQNNNVHRRTHRLTQGSRLMKEVTAERWTGGEGRIVIILDVTLLSNI